MSKRTAGSTRRREAAPEPVVAPVAPEPPPASPLFVDCPRNCAKDPTQLPATLSGPGGLTCVTCGATVPTR